MAIDLTKIKAVLFDFGDTLIYGNFTAGALDSIWEEVYRRLINPEGSDAITPLPRLRQAMQTHIHSAMARTWKEKTEQELEFLPMFRRAFEAAGIPRASDPAFLTQVVTLEHRLHYERVVEVAPGAFETLAALKERGYRLGLVSNFCNLPEVAYSTIRQVGILEYFDAAVLSCEIGWRKPSAHIYRAICERLEVQPQDCLFVGDRLIEDIQGPQRLGMQTVLDTQFRQDEPLPAIVPDATIENLPQLLDLLR